MFMTQANQNVRQVTGYPSQYTLEAKVWIYTNDTNPENPPAQKINNVLDQIDEILEPNTPQAKQTIGGLCEHCWIDGDIITDEGTLGDQSVAIFTIKILTTT